MLFDKSQHRQQLSTIVVHAIHLPIPKGIKKYPNSWAQNLLKRWWILKQYFRQLLSEEMKLLLFLLTLLSTQNLIDKKHSIIINLGLNQKRKRRESKASQIMGSTFRLKSYNRLLKAALCNHFKGNFLEFVHTRYAYTYISSINFYDILRTQN